MYESKQRYQELVDYHVRILELLVGVPIRHGDVGFCPRCGTLGMFDLDGLGFDRYIENSIYYSTVFNEWRCRICDFKMCS